MDVQRRHSPTQTREIVMARIAIATLQNGWDCRWSTPDNHADPASPAADTVVCERTGVQRRVSLAECEGCAHWEFAYQPTKGVSAVSLQDTEALLEPPSLTSRALYLATWLAIAAAAATLIAAGLTILTTPLAIPITVALFLSATALVGFGCSGYLPRP
jgi:hypothetical protein